MVARQDVRDGNSERLGQSSFNTCVGPRFFEASAHAVTGVQVAHCMLRRCTEHRECVGEQLPRAGAERVRTDAVVVDAWWAERAVNAWWWVWENLRQRSSATMSGSTGSLGSND